MGKSWLQYHMEHAFHAASKSKDPSTKVGCVLVDQEQHAISTGFNGFPRSVEDDPMLVPERYQRPEKYDWTIHAEANAVAAAARNGISVRGSTAYCTLFPCASCAALLVQSGVLGVVAPAINPASERDRRWMSSFERSMQMFNECKVTVCLLEQSNEGVWLIQWRNRRSCGN